jgi:hypothetical protein
MDQRRCGLADFDFPAAESENTDESSPRVRKSLLAHVSLPKINHLIDTEAAPFVPHGWSLEQHRSMGQLLWSDDSAGLWVAAGQRSRPMKGTLLRTRLGDKPALNASVLDHLFEFPELIPVSWEGLYVFFWGTIYRRHSGLAVRGLYLKDGILNAGSRLLTRRWSVFNPAAVSLEPEP